MSLKVAIVLLVHAWRLHIQLEEHVSHSCCQDNLIIIMLCGVDRLRFAICHLSLQAPNSAELKIMPYEE